MKKPGSPSQRRNPRSLEPRQGLEDIDVATHTGGTTWRGPGEELHAANERFGDQRAVRSDHWPEAERWSPQDNFPSGGYDDAYGWDMRVGGHYSQRDPDPELAWDLDRSDVFFGEEFGAGPHNELRSIPGARHPRNGGPKGYVRSDSRITDDICERISAMNDLDAADVSVLVKAGEVTLSGTVVDRASKFRLEQLCDGVAGVKEIHNALRIQRHSPALVGSR